MSADDPAAKELQLDLRTGDSDDHRSDILTVTVPRHITCHDLKGREFVKYVIEGSMGHTLTWKVRGAVFKIIVVRASIGWLLPMSRSCGSPAGGTTIHGL